MSGKTWTPEVFETLFQTTADPWNFEDSPYEHQKRARLLACMPPHPIRFAVELGCAIGVTTQALSPLCTRLLAVDASPTALTMAGRRCADLPNITFVEAFLPEHYPTSTATGCDLMIISELLYFLAPHDIRCLAHKAMQSLPPNGTILLVNWTGPTDTPCTGEQAANLFSQNCRENHWKVDHTEQSASYRIDRLIRVLP
ncbi:class I SAM-dependent DNA methyltransferase [Acetobacter conturbans]|uniref:Methyltransferase domain-containing protein n=1 Tax=Acetobacter conturbans TaxID=1737472 RepID=A0ABX0JZB7_9PROT|nr:SAM-dependent methyltransferase [Acetobacter conturbans]NHN87142.1 methyltransferase domain-containing protein [Acetobacter conturbans]